MAIVTVENLSAGLRSFHDVEKKLITLGPGKSRTFEMPAHHIMLLERTPAEKSTVKLTMSADEREKHDDELKEIRTANKAARAGARPRTPARAIAPTQRMPKIDTRFLTDPKTVDDDEPENDEAAQLAETEAAKVRKTVDKPKKKRVLLKKQGT